MRGVYNFKLYSVFSSLTSKLYFMSGKVSHTGTVTDYVTVPNTLMFQFKTGKGVTEGC